MTPTTVRAESWLAIAGGARGLGFFPADWPASMTPGIATVASEVSAISAGLLGPDTAVSATAPVVAAARALNGALYVIAVNPTLAAVRSTIHVAGLAGRSASVLGEGRSVTASADSIADTFGPLAVHLYVAAPP